MSLLTVPYLPFPQVLSSPAGSLSRPSASSSSMARSCRNSPSASARWSGAEWMTQLQAHCPHVTKKFVASSTSENQKKRRMAGHAAQQHVLLECPGICQLVNTMKSSIPDHRLDTTIWKFTGTQHFACFQREIRSCGVSHQRHTLHGLCGGGAPVLRLQCRELPQLRRGGRWTSE